MALSAGTRLGPYEILSALGAGGMGEVYRARDTKIGRDVALKILPAALLDDPERVARFQREAQMLGALNHPHIAAIYGFEESAGVSALVLELVDGPTLAERIKQGAVPVAEALTIAGQIADALEAAHEKGIIHRDLKPANLALTANDQVKVLDFGLAKLQAGGTGQAGRPGPGVAQGFSPAVSQSPTITTPAMMTGVGTILGTAAYMAPEQAKGREADRRSDVWAFGCVLFEMLSGRRAFEGEDVGDTLAAVLRAEPNWKALPRSVPAHVRRILTRCLEKNRQTRFADISTVRFLLTEGSVTGASPASSRRALPWAVAGAFAVVASALLVLWAPWRPAAPLRVTRATITTSGPAALTINGTDRDIDLSPDGTHVVYVGNNGTQLFVRALEALEPVAIASGVSLRGPFISPDGQWVGFIDNAGDTLTKVAITGGPPIPLAAIGGVPRGATWTPDDTIIFATNNVATGLMRVSAAGGMPEVLTRPDRAQGEDDHLWPEVLAEGRAVLFTITSQMGGLDAAKVAVRDLRTGTQKVLLRGGSHGRYVASRLASPKQGGHLVYVAAGTLRAIPFDPNRLETKGTAVPVLQQLVTAGNGAGDFAVAADGTLVYVDVPGSLVGNARTLVWVDRTSKEEPLAAPPRLYIQSRLSPDGTRVALASIDQENDLWIWDLRRATLTRLTLDPGEDWFPVWTPDGRRIIFSSNRSGQANLWWQAADGTGAAERLTTGSNPQLATGITPAGTAVVFQERTPTMGRDLLQLALDGTRRVTPLLQTKFDERSGIVSPDGRWLAYESNRSGVFEIYVRPLANVGGGQSQVSTTGGTQPLWARSGKELFYVGADGALLRVPVEASGATWNAGTPMKLLERRYYTGPGRTYDVSPDGQRFLMIKAPGTDASDAPPALIVVQHWDEELKRLVPTK